MLAQAEVLDTSFNVTELALLVTYHIATTINVPGYPVSVAQFGCFMRVDVGNTCLFQPVSQSCSHLCFLVNSDALCKVLTYCSTVLQQQCTEAASSGHDMNKVNFTITFEYLIILGEKLR
jgi:hypothetical protein